MAVVQNILATALSDTNNLGQQISRVRTGILTLVSDKAALYNVLKLSVVQQIADFVPGEGDWSNMFAQITYWRHSLKTFFVISLKKELVFFILVDFTLLFVVFAKVMLMLNHLRIDHTRFKRFTIQSFFSLFVFFVLIELHDLAFLLHLFEVLVTYLSNFFFYFVVDLLIREVVLGKPFLVFHRHFQVQIIREFINITKKHKIINISVIFHQF